jgi:trimeric autotransporter adhesin
VSVSPSSGSGNTRQFSFVAASPHWGAETLAWIYMQVNDSLGDAHGCYLRYDVAHRLFNLRNDDGTSWSTGKPLGAVTLSNSQCTINLTATTVTIGFGAITVSPALSFASGFSGDKQIWMSVTDSATERSTWHRMGAWTAGP